MSMELPPPATPEINTSDLSLFNIGNKSIRMPLASQIMVKREPAQGILYNTPRFGIKVYFSNPPSI